MFKQLLQAIRRLFYRPKYTTLPHITISHDDALSQIVLEEILRDIDAGYFKLPIKNKDLSDPIS